MSDANQKLEELGRGWEEFKRVNDERLKKVELQQADGDQKAALAKINEDLNSLGKDLAQVQLAAKRPTLGNDRQEDAEHKSAFQRYLRKGDITGLDEIQRKAMNSTSDPDGGFLVNRELDASIDRVVTTISAMARLARVVQIGSRSWQTRTKTSGMSATWPGEGATSGETTEPRYARVEVVAHPIEVEPWVANETLEDADINLEADLANEAGISFAEGEGASFITGTGVGKPQGIMAPTPVANSAYAWGSVGYLVSGKSAAFASVAPSDYLVRMQHGLKAQYRPGSAWIMADATLSTVRQFKDASGTFYLWNPDPAAGFGGRLLGAPVEIDDNVAVVAANSLSIAYGNWQRAYAIVQRTGTSVIRDPYTGKGVTKFNFRRRVGGGIINFEAFKVMKFATS